MKWEIGDNLSMLLGLIVVGIVVVLVGGQLATCVRPGWTASNCGDACKASMKQMSHWSEKDGCVCDAKEVKP